MKREGYINWDEYFMGVALLAAMRSKDPSTQVGCSDDEYPWDRTGEDTKYPFVVHAELNAILNAQGKSLAGAKLYVALFPCNECAKAIIQSGIKEVVYLSDKYANTAGTLASKRMLRSAGVTLTPLRAERKQLVLNFDVEE